MIEKAITVEPRTLIGFRTVTIQKRLIPKTCQLFRPSTQPTLTEPTRRGGKILLLLKRLGWCKELKKEAKSD